ncbi:MAG: acyloxyacyl hydrolase [Chitinophagales bacterium]|nr:acyloxyacyl hydrolase [Chitinophagaceae bacterium]MCB9064735.1 acyloxyacyl hydrolase [Chitinophagales bacterium]
MRTTYRSLLVVALVLSISSVRAQFLSPVQQKVNTFETGMFKELGYQSSFLNTFSVGREYRLRTWWAGGAEVFLYKYNQKEYSSLGASIRPVSRIYFYSAKKFELFGETKGGVIFMFPQNTYRSINFTFEANLGADIYLFKNDALRISSGYNHFSNGKRTGDAINPPWDGIGISLAFVKTIL